MSKNIDQEKNAFILSRANIPKRYLDMDFDKLADVSPILIDLCKTYVSNFPNKNKKRGLYLFSNTPGNAKTSLSISILKGLISANKIKTKVHYISFLELINYLRQRDVFNQTPDIDDDYEYIIKTSDFIVLDDVGKQVADTRMAGYYFYLVNLLYEEDIPCLMTSNFNLDELGARFEIDPIVANSVYSRIQEMCELIKLNNKDYRIK